jgi:GNAT superfamily N-acetyltransferase
VRFFRHYKNKPYRYQGIAKHSETFEDLVVYECLYPNELATLWVRPKKMFEEMVGDRPRFEKIEPMFEFISNSVASDLGAAEPSQCQRFPTARLREGYFELLAQVNPVIFPDWNEAEFRKKISDKKDVMLLLARIDDQVVGYKLGYGLERGLKCAGAEGEIFYSMLGGVLPKFRRLGLAGQLMNEQHAWAKMRGYQTVQTKTMNEHRAMLALNIKLKFDIISAELDPGDGRFKILMEKKL